MRSPIQNYVYSYEILDLILILQIQGYLQVVWRPSLWHHRKTLQETCIPLQGFS